MECGSSGPLCASHLIRQSPGHCPGLISSAARTIPGPLAKTMVSGCPAIVRKIAPDFATCGF